MPKLVRLYIRQTAIGFVISAAFVAMLLGANVANLWHLVTHTSAGPLAVFLLWLFNGIVFSGVQFGIAVMRMAEPEPRRPGGGRPRMPAVRPAPVPVRVPAEGDTRR
jgi:predicted branched-subunit amino acid permease